MITKIISCDCGCIYYQRVFRDGDLDPYVGIYRNAEDGPCEVCMALPQNWRDRLIEETVVYNSKIEIEADL